VRVLLTIWVAKLVGVAIRLLGRAGTHLPGKFARRMHPGIIGALRHPKRIVVVTGTNGKTTASNLLAEALMQQGLRVASNRTGSNLVEGIATTLIGAVTWLGTPRADIAVIEMDERSAKLVLPGLDPDVLVCTNLTRDSIKRNAHPDYIAWILSSALSSRASLVLNADDLITAALGTDENPRVFFAVDQLGTDTSTPQGAAVDAAICPVCDHTLAWDYWRYNHIGHAHCPSCGFRSPAAQYRASSIDPAGETLTIHFGNSPRSVRLVNDNIVNVYNEVAVAAALDVLGIEQDAIVAAFDSLKPPETRFASEKIGDTALVRLLTKGLVGVACSRAFQYVQSFVGRKALLLSIDEATERVTEVENTAWTYDADYEYLADDSIGQIYVGGVRRHDQALRLAIAGVDLSRIMTIESETAGADLVGLDDIEAVFNLHSVHNALSTGNPVQVKLRDRLKERAR
jgi:lipid II isoglutaminyl synthase (glutamine-hydrolysing)